MSAWQKRANTHTCHRVGMKKICSAQITPNSSGKSWDPGAILKPYSGQKLPQCTSLTCWSSRFKMLSAQKGSSSWMKSLLIFTRDGRQIRKVTQLPMMGLKKQSHQTCLMMTSASWMGLSACWTNSSHLNILSLRSSLRLVSQAGSLILARLVSLIHISPQ